MGDSRPAGRQHRPRGSPPRQPRGASAAAARGSALRRAQSRHIVREQFFMLLLEPEASLAAIPKLLPASEAEHRAGLDAIRGGLAATGQISRETARRFDRVTQLFGLTAEPQAK